MVPTFLITELEENVFDIAVLLNDDRDGVVRVEKVLVSLSLLHAHTWVGKKFCEQGHAFEQAVLAVEFENSFKLKEP